MAYVEQPWALTPNDLARVREVVKALDLAPGPGGSRITPVPESLHAAMLEAIGMGNYERVAVVVLYPSSQLVGHCDPPLPRSVRGVDPTRIHVPLDVNDGCWVFHAGTWQQLQVGHAYQMDPTQVHGAVNWGATVRKHLILDS